MIDSVKVTGTTIHGDVYTLFISPQQVYAALAELNDLAYVSQLKPYPVHNNPQSDLAPSVPLYYRREEIESRVLGKSYLLTRLGFQEREVKDSSPRKNYTYEVDHDKFHLKNDRVINLMMDSLTPINRVEDMPRGEVISIEDKDKTFYINIHHGTMMYIEHGSDVIHISDGTPKVLKEDIRLLAMARFNQKYL